MKLLIFFALIITLVKAEPPSELENEERIQGWLEDIVNKTINDITSKLDEPIVVNNISLNFNSTGVLEGHVTVTDLKLFGLKYMVAPYIKVDGITNLTLTLKIPQILLLFKYGLDVTLLDLIPLYGQGPNIIEIDTIQLNITGKISIRKAISVDDLKVLITLGDAVFNLNGVLNNPEFTSLVNLVLNDNFVEFVDDNNALISNILGQIIADLINSVLSSKKIN